MMKRNLDLPSFAPGIFALLTLLVLGVGCGAEEDALDRGDRAFRAQDWEQAARELSRALEQGVPADRDREARLWLALASAKAGESAEALEALSALLERHPDEIGPKEMKLVGDALQSAGLAPAAAQVYADAKVRFPEAAAQFDPLLRSASAEPAVSKKVLDRLGALQYTNPSVDSTSPGVDPSTEDEDDPSSKDEKGQPAQESEKPPADPGSDAPRDPGGR